MNGYEIRAFKTANGNYFVYEVDTLPGTENPLIIGEGYYVDPEGNLLPPTKENGKIVGPRRNSAVHERQWAQKKFADKFKEETIKGPLAEKLSNLFDRTIPKQRTFGAPKERYTPFEVLESLREKMGR